MKTTMEVLITYAIKVSYMHKNETVYSIHISNGC